MFKVDWTRLSEKEQLETAQLILDDVDKGSRLLNENDSFPFPLFDRKGKACFPNFLRKVVQTNMVIFACA